MSSRHAVTMPNLGVDMTSGRIASWLKDVGDHVARGEPIAEIETDKTTLEMEAVLTGVLTEIVHREGAEVAVGETIAFIEVEDE